jgi:hypothetical protein
MTSSFNPNRYLGSFNNTRPGMLSKVLDETKLAYFDEPCIVSFQYKKFAITYELYEHSSQGLKWVIDFTYDGKICCPRQFIPIGLDGYSILLLKAAYAKRLPFDLSQNIIQNRLSRREIIDSHGLQKELLFHLQCILNMFQIIDRILQTHGQTYKQYCAESKKLRHQSEDTFNSFLFFNACQILEESEMEVGSKILNIGKELEQMQQLWG